MPEFGLESILLAFVFLVPGFIVRAFIRAGDPGRQREESALTELMATLSYGLLIFSILFVIYLLLPYGRDQYARLAALGFVPYLQHEPDAFYRMVFYWIVGSIALAVMIGYVDPLQKATAYRVRRRGQRSTDVWLRTLAERDDPRKDHTWAIVRMKTGGYYEGLLTRIEPAVQASAEGRDFALEGVFFVPEEKSQEGQAEPRPLMVIPAEWRPSEHR